MNIFSIFEMNNLFVNVLDLITKFLQEESAFYSLENIMNKSKFVFTGVLLKENSGVSAICPDVDVATEGETKTEAKENLIEAVSLYIESAFENNIPILRPIPLEENPLVTDKGNVLEKFNIKIDFKVKTYA